ncbi:hypothetical protein B0T26DRAFT_744273 [Lasiosphaeria miniovina]|uniref:DUF8032 domain-containing protein n=1 Tax=Lasiosphaeria miniovina TaxID=1954250 RepID=A0AA39ZTU7_9PEZI|nr:uncharacterized protein B0T26DRAFT_744273 [Lasiosphaeria miniovina]KAK0703455.1 hypothetical protein B0T26DRAFT_744273 [Lasiosphaeria miniovina]
MVVSSMQHHTHHQQQGSVPPHLQHSRPPSIVHQQQHHSQAPPQQQQQQHPGAYSYQQQSQATTTQEHNLPYYAHPSPYSTPGATSGYTSADTGEMMAATMPRPPYPPMSYHTPQSNSPASVASPSGHDQQRTMYGQPPSQLHQHQQSLYYAAPQQPYQAPSPYAQHPQQQSHQSMASQQPNMMMSHAAPQHQLSQHPSQHPQAGMTVSPRQGKIEAHSLNHRIAGAAAPVPLGSASSNPPQNGAPLSTPTGSAAGVNPNAAPGPIPATTPLVVRQDTNGVQWIAFEYSRDRVKMEYTIRCDVESVNHEELSAEFKTENCVYPRACCPKEQYRGNRLQYETECNTVGWALAQLNPPLRGKRGLIQRAVDSWRNSNQDPRLRSRRVRRMAKMNHRNKPGSTTPHASHMAGPAGSSGMSTPTAMGPASTAAMGKPGLNNMGTQMHHHHAHSDGNAQGGGDELHHHHHQAPSQPGSEERPAQVFTGYGSYPGGAPHGASSMPSVHDTINGSPHAGSSAIPARRASPAQSSRNDEPDDLFPVIPEAKKRKFILVEDSDRQSRLRVRVTLDGVDTREIPDSFRKGSSVYPRSYFPREMQSPPPSATGSKFFTDDTSDVEDDGITDTEGRRAGRGSNASSSSVRRGGAKAMVKVPMGDGQEGEVAIPRMRRTFRGKEVRLNDLGYRMAWLQSRVFAGRTVFLQRALDSYRNKTRSAIESVSQDVRTSVPHYETRVGKRRWNERMRGGGSGDKKDEDA